MLDVCCCELEFLELGCADHPLGCTSQTARLDAVSVCVVRGYDLRGPPGAA